MSSSAISLAAKGVTSTLDQASTTLASGIISSDLTISLATGGGAKFPQPYNGTCSSLGTATTLNCTGISATIGGVGIGKMIRNVTDGSVAFITAIGTNALTTTALVNGSDNLWESSDAWRIDEFVVTFATQTTNTYGVITDTVLEEALVIARSTDTLTIASGGRGYNGTTASAFSTADAVQLRVTSAVQEGMRYTDFEIANQGETNRQNIATANTNITNLQTGSYWYVVTTGSANAYVAASPAFGSLAAGSDLVIFKANFTNTGSATLAVNGLTAKTIKKLDGATNLVSGDIVSGQIVVVQYDGTNFQMLSPVGQVTTGSVASLAVRYLQTGANKTTTSTTFADIDATNWTTDVVCTANTIVQITVSGSWSNSGAGFLAMDLSVGGSRVGSTMGLVYTLPGAGNNQAFCLHHVVVPGAGTKTIKPQWRVQSGTGTLDTSSTCTAVFTVVKIEP